MSDLVAKEVEFWAIAKLKEYSANAKKHTPEQVSKIAASITQFGWSQSKAIEVEPDGTIITGHGRRLAALKLGLLKVPVVVRNDLSKEQARAYRLADNAVAESEYDTQMLAEELKALHVDLAFDMSELFDARDLDFATLDLGDMNDEALTADINLEVDAQRIMTAEKVAAGKARKHDIGKVLGFRNVDEPQRRIFNRLITLAEDVTQKTGADAVTEYLAKHVF